jgi:hypothetical protein
MFGTLSSRVSRGFLYSASPCVVPLLVLAAAASPGFAGAIEVPTTGAGCVAIVSENNTTTFTPCSDDLSVTTSPNGGISLSNPNPVELTLLPAANVQAGILVYTDGDFSAAVPAGTAFPIQYSFGHADLVVFPAMVAA